MTPMADETDRRSTGRQLGSALGAAGVGALPQRQLTGAPHDKAVPLSGRLPGQARARFVAGLTRPGAAGLDVGPRPLAGPGGGLPPAAALAHQVFTLAFVDAMRTTLFVVAMVVAGAAVSCLAIAQARRAPAAAPAPGAAGGLEPAVAAAAGEEG
jgi:hypothetical protein